MEMKELINQILFTALKKYGITKAMITAEKAVIADLHADSLDIIEMMLAFEEEFDILINEEDIAKIVTVGDIYEYVEKNKNRVPVAAR